MPLPLPELLRTYGDLLHSQNGALFRTLAWLVASVLFLVAVFTVGAVVQGVLRWWQRTAERRRQDAGPAGGGADPPHDLHDGNRLPPRTPLTG